MGETKAILRRLAPLGWIILGAFALAAGLGGYMAWLFWTALNSVKFK